MSYPRLTKCMPDESRPNPFHLLHKALRFGHCRMLSELGAQDFGDDGVSAQLLPSLANHLDLYRAVAEARQEALMATLSNCGLNVDTLSCLDHARQDHAGHITALTELVSLVRAVNVAAPQRRRPASRSIYRCYALYAASDMARMDEDETLLLTALHDNLDDEALRRLEGHVFAGLAPTHFEPLMRMLLPGLSSAELGGLLAVLQQHLEPTYYDSVVEPVMRPLVSTGSSAAA